MKNLRSPIFFALLAACLVGFIEKMLQFRVLYRKKNRADTGVLYHILSEVIKEAKEYELYELLVEAVYFKKMMVLINLKPRKMTITY